MDTPSELTYAQIREANIARNKKLLDALDLGSALAGVTAAVPRPKPKPKRTPKASKRKIDVLREDENDAPSDAEPEAKSARVGEAAADAPSSVRRSGRNAGKTVDYKSEQQGRPDMPLASVQSGLHKAGDAGDVREPAMKRKHDPKQYGHIPGVSVGDCWVQRIDASADAVHAPPVAGITCGPQGSYSICLNGGYDDDVDMGYTFTYTGSGGRLNRGTASKPKNLRTGPQMFDQSFDEPCNAALLRSIASRKPVRVLRGPKCSKVWGPVDVYRYDGLYTVEKSWMERGLNTLGMNPKGFKVCKFAFKRLPGQPPLVKYDPEVTADEEAAEESAAEDE